MDEQFIDTETVELVEETEKAPTTETAQDEAKASKFADRMRPLDSDILTKTVMRNLAYGSDVAARTRKLRTIGYESTDVLNKVAGDLLAEAALTGTTDTSPGRIARLCHNYAETLQRMARKEVASGDATDVTGETEHKAENAEFDADGGERQKRAVMGRKPRMAGIRRADPYAISDYSRDNMRAADIRYIVDTEREVLHKFLETPFVPNRAREAEVLEQVIRDAQSQSDDYVTLPDILLGTYKPLVLRKRTERIKSSYVDESGTVVDLPTIVHKPGEVRKWRGIRFSDLTDTPLDQTHLAHALRNWASRYPSVIRAHWEQDGADQVMRAEIGLFLQDRDNVGQGTPEPINAARLADRAWVLKFDHAEESPKEARRWRYFADQDYSDMLDNPAPIELMVWDPAERTRLDIHREWVIRCLSALNTQRWLQLGRTLVPGLCNIRNL